MDFTDQVIYVSLEEDEPRAERRPGKGRLTYTYVDDYVCIDTETTGLDPNCDEIIDIGAVHVKHGQVVDRFQTLVRPSRPVTDFITQLTGIRNEMLNGAPLIHEILPDFLDFISNYRLVGHNVRFDINFLYDAMYNNLSLTLRNNYTDTMWMSRRILPELTNHKLVTISSHYHIAEEIDHRALSDALVAYQCYEAMKNQVPEDEFLQMKCPMSHKKLLKAKDFQPETDVFDPMHPAYGRVFVFTGNLASMDRRQAMQLVMNRGGQCSDSVTAKTNFLVLGNCDYRTAIKCGKSAKHKRAEELILKGKDLQIISENVFLDLICTSSMEE